jgi:hypothetical protein
MTNRTAATPVSIRSFLIQVASIFLGAILLVAFLFWKLQAGTIRNWVMPAIVAYAFWCSAICIFFTVARARRTQITTGR